MKDDPRIIKTLGKLQRAFVLLLKTYDVDDINVRQISDEAGVTRGAFYSHFSDKNAFVTFTMNGLVDSLLKTALKDSVDYVEELNHENAHETDVLSVSKFFNNIADEYQTYTVVMSSGKLPDFTVALKQRLSVAMKDFAEYYDDKINLEGFPIDVLSSYYVDGLIGMVNLWLSDGMVYTPHYMASAAKLVLGNKNQIDSSNMVLPDFFVD
ncbi:TetR/AcrR family transcriptional regulator [Pediococcus stilesii]|uniref:TetR/AcrR family transcriptional regulator n=1 Tax=Pediococcus stilesii TaxID=331679 RepID=A0A5R9BVQ5_9LACO|nr:TetR/AcrR family transcriptional regulator [Pediococcus stilesii]TLQ04645.1 TetR/AcrR family transcriptional regulator [Pediococcus stilesii]